MWLENAFLFLCLVGVALFGAIVPLSARSHESARGWRRHAWLVAGNGALTLALVSAFGFGGEAYFRFWYDQSDSWMLTRAGADWLERHFHLNSWGIRDSINYRVEKPPGKPRVVFLGDSFTAGHGVADVERRFANRIRRSRPGWEVHVLARNGVDSLQELSLLEELPPEYRFECLVLVYAMNDISALDPKGHDVFESIYGEPPPFLAVRSYLLNALHFRWMRARNPHIRNYFDFTLSAYQDGGIWQTQRELLRRIRRQAEARGGTLVAVTFPFLHSLGPAYRFRDVHRLLGEFWSSEGVPHLDLLESLERHTGEQLTANAQDAHPGEAAHAIAAAAIMPFLDRHLEERAGAAR